MRVFVFCIGIPISFGCGGGEDGDPICDPTGAWSLTLTRTSGTCAASLSDTLTIAPTTDSWLITDESNLVYAGTVAQGAGLCILSIGATGGDADYTATIDYDIDLDDQAGVISGTASVGLDDLTGIPPDASCGSGYSVRGSRL